MESEGGRQDTRGPGGSPGGLMGKLAMEDRKNLGTGWARKLRRAALLPKTHSVLQANARHDSGQD